MRGKTGLTARNIVQKGHGWQSTELPLWPLPWPIQTCLLVYPTDPVPHARPSQPGGKTEVCLRLKRLLVCIFFKVYELPTTLFKWKICTTLVLESIGDSMEKGLRPFFPKVYKYSQVYYDYGKSISAINGTITVLTESSSNYQCQHDCSYVGQILMQVDNYVNGHA